MAIRIDANMMAVKSAELTQEADAALKKTQLMHEFLAIQSRVLEQYKRSRVLKSGQADKIYLHTNAVGDFGLKETGDNRRGVKRRDSKDNKNSEHDSDDSGDESEADYCEPDDGVAADEEKSGSGMPTVPESDESEQELPRDEFELDQDERLKKLLQSRHILDVDI